MDHAQYHYRLGHEEAAASEVQKAICWLEYARDHADKPTREILWKAIQDLKSVQLDVKKGDSIGATAFNNSLILAGWPNDSAQIIGVLTGIRLLLTGVVLWTISSAIRATEFNG